MKVRSENNQKKMGFSLNQRTLLARPIIGLTMGSLLFTACDKKVKLDTDAKKSSYAIGQQIGQNLKNQGIEIDTDAMAQSMKDAIAGNSQMTKEEIQGAMMKLQESAMKRQTELGEKNKKDGLEFLEKNKAKDGVKVTASGLQYIVEKPGDGKLPTKEDTVKCHYTGTLTNGEKFDSSVDRGQPAEFPVGGVIPGWTEALLMMKPGAKFKLFIPPELAYGASGRPGIPPNSVLVFDVELIEIVKKSAPAGEAKPTSEAPKGGKKTK